MQGKFRSEPVALDLARYELTRSGLRIGIEHIPMELLILLAHSGGRLVTRAEIINHLWGKNPWLDADRNLNTAIGKIRRALGDDPDKPRYIETAVGKGYRFIAGVRKGTDSGGWIPNGHAELVILDSSSPGSSLPPVGPLKTPASEKPGAPDSPDQPAISQKANSRIVLSSAWVGAGILFLFMCVFGWTALDRLGWIFHDRDTPVWMRGDWLVGEYRLCQMKTEAAQRQKDFSSPAEPERLYCGEDANGVSEFQAATPPVPTDHGENGPSAPSSERDHDFHIMAVRYFGKTERSDKPLISWRCRRNSDSLTCKTLD